MGESERCRHEHLRCQDAVEPREHPLCHVNGRQQVSLLTQMIQPLTNRAYRVELHITQSREIGDILTAIANIPISK